MKDSCPTTHTHTHTHIYIYIYIYIEREREIDVRIVMVIWLSSYKMNTATRVQIHGRGCFVFHKALIPLEKAWIQLFSYQLWVNSRADWALHPWYGNQSRKRKTLNSNLLTSIENDLIPHSARGEGLDWYIYILWDVASMIFSIWLVALKKSWKQHRRKKELYGHQPPISKTMQIRRPRHGDTARGVRTNS